MKFAMPHLRCLKPRQLSSRFAWLVAIATALLVTVIVRPILSEQATTTRARIERDAERMAQQSQILYAAQAPAARAAVINQWMQSERDFHGGALHALTLWNSQGHTLLHAGALAFGKTHAEYQGLKRQLVWQGHTVFVPFEFDEVLGLLSYDASAEFATVRRATDQVIFLAAFGWLMTMGAVVLAARKLTEPLRELAQAAEVVIADEAYSYRIGVRAEQDELGRLARRFNDMLRSIEERNRLLAEHRRTLEARVQERTEALSLALNSAEAAAETKSRFLTVMNHELRTPLNGVLGSATLLAETTLTLPQQELLQNIRHCGLILLEILEDVLELARGDDVVFSLDPVLTDIHDLAQELIETHRDRANAKGLSLRLEAFKFAPNGARVDAKRLRQVLNRLVDNALKFTDQGGVTVEVSANTVSHLLRFVVRDTGPGIAQGELARLFTPFTLGDDSRTRAHGGTGVGLAMAYRLVRVLGGHLSVTSALGEGSVFEVEVPAVLEELPNARHEMEGYSIDPGMRVLVAEDNPLNQKIILSFLRKFGVHAEMAPDGMAAVQIAVQQPFDLILMDVQMPRMDGLEATRNLRGMGHTQTKIVALTAHAMPDEKERCLAAGMNGFMTKPLHMDELHALLARTQRLQRSPDLSTEVAEFA